MNIETVEETDDVLKVKLEDANPAVANTLRRAMIVKVPTLAVKEIYVNQNESGLFDEVLANRIGQVPWIIPQNVDEEDEVHVALKQEGPGNVHASDLKADNDEAEPVNPDTLLVELKDGQELTLEGVATLQTADTHAKHQGGTVGYEKIGEGEFEFRIESTSGYGNRDLLEEAIEQVLEDLESFEEELDDY
jgi:DNA-directed RNA polymerase alpha subunit